MGCGCNKKKNVVVTTEVEKCELSVQEIENLRLLIIQKDDFEDKEDILVKLLEMKDKYYEICPNKEEFDLLKKYVGDV